MNEANIVIRAARFFSVISLLASGTITTLCFFPICSDKRRIMLRKKWSFALIRAMGLKIDARLVHLPPGSLIVSNHISWVDVFVINSVLPSAFIAKDEIQRWPLIGWLAEKNETVFMKRKSPKQALHTNLKIADLLQQGKFVTVFPEGTTSDGHSVLEFHSALIQPALDAGKPVVPLAVSYWEPDGQKSLAPRYDGNITFYQSMMAILAKRHLTAKLVTMQPLGLSGETRRQIATAARESILAT
ncbi:MAG: 1-acyl-sn-glycerol-3-phosphate acyltransferase [Oxalobacter sp.]|nr:MAG: 1-acyl-sn-glycerol-3-phosphate acyltransferase [Oxalobacter sp.]